MKNTRTCPKCASKKVICIQDSPAYYGLRLKTGIGTIAEVSHFICCDCGYAEEWVTDKGDLDKLYEKHDG